MRLAHSGAFALVLDASPKVWTSLEEFHFRLLKAYRNRGVPAVIVFANLPPDEYAQRMATSGAAIETLNFAKGKGQYYRGLGELVRKHGITTVQTRGFNYFHPIWWMLRLQGVRRVIFVEGNSGLLRARSWKRVLLRMRAGVLTWPVTHIVSISDFVKRQLVELGIPEPKIQRIYNGVDAGRYHPDPLVRREWREQYGLKPEEALISTIAYLRTFKNPQVMFEACGILAARRFPFRYFVAGTGDLVEPMKQLSQKLGFADRIHWLGNFARTERLLQASDVFMLSSVGEALGNAFLEASACGVPIVGADSGGIPEIVVPGETGFLASATDPAAFADGIQKIMSDESLRGRMPDQCVARARTVFDLDRAVANFLAVYDALPAE
jgi:glycosyltransferase involved in cell wall biosynthesis